MTCPLCGLRKARRRCPALAQDICAVCCGTKRLVDIACPADCSYLTSSREHPPAVAVRQHQQDMALLYRSLADFSERQSRLFLLVATAVKQYAPPDLETLIDADVREAADALAATFETSARGVIYEHRPASRPAERLLVALKAPILEAGASGGTVFEREAAVVLRRFSTAAGEAALLDPGNPRALLTWLGRVLRGEPPAEASTPPGEPPRLIVP